MCGLGAIAPRSSRYSVPVCEGVCGLRCVSTLPVQSTARFWGAFKDPQHSVEVFVVAWQALARRRGLSHRKIQAPLTSQV